jgi:hypothetical protein
MNHRLQDPDDLPDPASVLHLVPRFYRRTHIKVSLVLWGGDQSDEWLPALLGPLKRSILLRYFNVFTAERTGPPNFGLCGLNFGQWLFL